MSYNYELHVKRDYSFNLASNFVPQVQEPVPLEKQLLN